jgi:hypothetical protein
MRISDFDNFYDADMFNGIAGLFGHVNIWGSYANVADDQAHSWYLRQPSLEIAQGLIDIQIFWGNPCNEWAKNKSADPGAYPIEGTGWQALAGGEDLDILNGRLVIALDDMETLCPYVLGPAHEVPACLTWLNQQTSWPMS